MQQSTLRGRWAQLELEAKNLELEVTFHLV